MKARTLALSMVTALACSAAINTASIGFDDGTLNAGGAVTFSGTTGNAAQYTPGVAGKAIRLDNDFLKFPTENIVNVNSASISFWFRPQNWSDKQIGFIPIAALDEKGGHSWKMLLYYANNPGAPHCLDFRMKMNDGREIIAQAYTKDMAPGKWQHVVLCWTDNEMKIHLNGDKGTLQSYGLPKKREMKPSYGLYFMPTDFWGKRNGLVTDIDDIRIFDAFLTESEAKQLYLEHSSADNEKRAVATIPKAEAKVTIDGALEASEWADASRVPLAISMNSKTMYGGSPAWVMMKNDGANLLLAFEIEGKSNAYGDGKAKRVTMDDKAASGNFWSCPTAEIDIPTENGGHLQYFVNSANTWAKLTSASTAWKDKSDARAAAKATAKGWTAEMQIPLSELEIAGDTIKANFGLKRFDDDLTVEPDKWITWNIVGESNTIIDASFLDKYGFLKLNAPKVRIESLGNIANGALDFQAGNGVSLTLKDLVTGKENTYAQKTATPLTWTGITSVTLNSKDLYWNANVLIREIASLETVCHGNDRIIDFNVALKEGDKKIAEALAKQVLKATISIIGKNGEIIASSDETLAKHKSTLKLHFPQIPEGEYTLQLNINGAGITYQTSQPFGVPDMSFLGFCSTVEDCIPEPWTKPARNGREVTTAFHKYQFGDGIFPDKAWSFQQPVLTGSTGLYITVDGKKTTFAPVEATQDADTYESLVSSGKLKSRDGKVLLTWKRVIDYDSLLRVDFSIEPANAPVELSDFGIQFSIPEAASKIALTPEIDIAWENGTNHVSAPFFIGSTGKKGFCAFTDNNANYVFPKNANPFKINRKQDNGATITVTFINGKAKLGRKAEYTLAVMATPGKPPRQDWRKLHGEGWLCYKGQNMAIRGWSHERKLMGFKRCNYMAWPVNPEGIHQEIKSYRDKGVDCIPYSTSNMIPSSNPLYDYFAKDWERAYHGEAPKSSPGVDYDGTPYFLFIPVCQNIPQYRDYICYWTAKNMDTFGFKGIYFDAGGTTLSNRPFNLIQRERVLTPERPVEIMNVFGTREMYKCLRKIIKKRAPNGYLYAHNWRNFHPAWVSFVDMLNPGEEFMHSFPADWTVYMTNKSVCSPGLWRYVYNSETTGAAIQFLSSTNFHPRLKEWFNRGLESPQVIRERYEASKAAIGMCLLNDIQMSGAGYAGSEGLWAELDKLDISSADFHTDYEQKELNATGADVKIAYYTWKASPRKLIVMVNMDRKPVSVKLNGAGNKLSEVWPCKCSVDKDFVLIDGCSFRLLINE